MNPFFRPMFNMMQILSMVIQAISWWMIFHDHNSIGFATLVFASVCLYCSHTPQAETVIKTVYVTSRLPPEWEMLMNTKAEPVPARFLENIKANRRTINSGDDHSPNPQSTNANNT